MGLAELSIYLDSCLAIYLVEENASFAAKLENALAANLDAKFCISPLSEMECLIMPLRGQNNLLITKFENWFRIVEVCRWKVKFSATPPNFALISIR